MDDARLNWMRYCTSGRDFPAIGKCVTRFFCFVSFFHLSCSFLANKWYDFSVWLPSSICRARFWFCYCNRRPCAPLNKRGTELPTYLFSFVTRPKFWLFYVRNNTIAKARLFNVLSPSRPAPSTALRPNILAPLPHDHFVVPSIVRSDKPGFWGASEFQHFRRNETRNSTALYGVLKYLPKEELTTSWLVLLNWENSVLSRFYLEVYHLPNCHLLSILLIIGNHLCTSSQGAERHNRLWSDVSCPNALLLHLPSIFHHLEDPTRNEGFSIHIDRWQPTG